jgi:hypothetical protein
MEADASTLLRSLFDVVASGSADRFFFLRLMQFSRRNRFPQRIGLQIQFLGDLGECVFIIQQGLNFLQYFWSQYGGTTPPARLKETSRAFFTVEFDAAFNADPADPEGPAYICLFDTAVYS